jgi:SWI/SNF-related matrix-associated actin-dependent regulator of chromatin subfamily A-like protein 1
MNLYTYQRDAVTWLAARPKAFLALDQGLGKTAVACTDMQFPALVVCPTTLKINWARELQMWRPGSTSQIIDGSTKVIDPDVDLTIINYDILHKFELPATYQTMVIDECHYAKSATAKRTKACVKLIRSTPRVRLLSGTPVVNRPIELFPLLKAIGGTKLDYINFGRRYCAGWTTPWGSFDVSGASRLEELYEKLSDYMLRVTKETALPELPAKTYRIIELDLPLSMQEKKLLRQDIDRPAHEIPFQAIADIQKLNAQRKLPLAVEHIKNVLEHAQNVVIFGWHTEIIYALAKLLKDYGVVIITGSTPKQDRQDAVDDFQNKKARVFIGNIKAAGVGITLTAASNVVFVETTWTPADLHQASDRCHRIGQKEHVQVDVLTISKSIDSMQLHSILDKTDIINQLVKEDDMDSAQLLKIAKQLEGIAAELKGWDPVEPKEIQDPPVTAAKLEKPLTLDDLRVIAKTRIDKDGNMDAVKAALAELKADKLSSLAKDQYSSFAKLLEA